MRETNINIIKLTDSYKVSHYKQYPEGTTNVFSFFESRGGKFPEVTFFGLQYFLKRYLEGVVVTEQKIQEAKKYFEMHFGSDNLFNGDGWRHILNKHGGMLPVEIKSVAEGTTIPVSNVLMTIENTDPEVPWLTNYLETLLVQVWYPTTVCTQSRQMKHVILKYLDRTGSPELIDFKLHDFGFRGSTSVESAGIGGAAHLVNFLGTDTMAALDIAHDYYGENMAGFSIPAAEHSTITSWGQENEVDAYRNMLNQYPNGLVAVVSDSYNIYESCEKLWGEELKDEVLNRDGTVVIRPDSGNPVEVVCKVLNILGNKFGYKINHKGYKTLNPHVRIIQGDGIDYSTLCDILLSMENNGWSADNIAFGSGGGLLQKMDRDTQRFAFKCSAIKINGEWKDVMKNPITDSNKKSKAGRLALFKGKKGYETITEDNRKNELKTVFINGEIVEETTFSDVRDRAKIKEI